MGGGLSVVGFPFGLTGGGLAVWVRGFIASEPDLDHDDLPRFLIDSRTRPGQSGSPVVYYQEGGTVMNSMGELHMVPGIIEDFWGFYSGRINERSDLGFVWKRSALQEIIVGGCRGTVPGPSGAV
jgi:hypothetical protein